MHKKFMLGVALSLCSTYCFAMGAIGIYPQVNDGQYIDAEISVDCKGCWWDETAQITGTVVLRGASTKEVPINKSVKIYSGEYNSKVVNLATLDYPYQYSNAILRLAVSGPNTDTVRLDKVVSFR